MHCSRGLRICTAILAICFALNHARADVRLPQVFGDHMVFQQEKEIQIWGWAAPNESVKVELGTASAQTTANEKGEWKVSLAAMKATTTPLTLTVTGANTVKFDDILMGEVWLCSGQSNMEMGMTQIADSKKEIETANHPHLRILLVAHQLAAVPQTNFPGEWKVCTPKTVTEGGWGGFSAAAYFFGRELQAKLNIPIGLIESSWGGTRIEPWTPPVGFAGVQSLGKEYEAVQLAAPGTTEHRAALEKTLQEVRHWLDDAGQSLSNNTSIPAMPAFPQALVAPHEVQDPTILYNGMIYPLVPFSVRGFLWYQGESNLKAGAIYADHMKALVAGWRQLWRDENLPFYYVQIAPYNYGTDPEAEGVFWEAQNQAQSIPNTGMVVINDIGNIKDIHPKNKQEVGRRLANWALVNTYHQTGIEYSGPIFQSMNVDGDKLRLTFDHADGLTSRDGKPLSNFEIIDADEGGYVKADAKLDGQSILLSSPEVKHPVAMRFAWSMFAEPNLMNAAGLPSSAFRAGSVPKRDLLAMRVAEAKSYQLVYDLDLAKLGPDIQYDVDNSANFSKPFDRVAYFIELQKAEGETEYLYVSMDAFTDNLKWIGIPTVASGAKFQQNVVNMNVFSDVKGVVTGTNLDGGNIEFWPNNYGTANDARVPNALAEAYDFGDQMFDPADGYGSMQVHNHDARQTLFSVNHWKEGARADIGIGNSPVKLNPDWTFAGNAGEWKMKRLRVLVRTK